MKVMVTVLSDKKIFLIFLKGSLIPGGIIKVIVVVSAERNFSEFETMRKVNRSTTYGCKYEGFKLRKMMTVMTNILEIPRPTRQ